MQINAEFDVGKCITDGARRLMINAFLKRFMSVPGYLVVDLDKEDSKEFFISERDLKEEMFEEYIP